MRCFRFQNRLGKAHLILFSILLLLFTVLTFLATWQGVDDGPGHLSSVLAATAGTSTGPFTGAIARGMQGCCLAFSLRLACIVGPILMVGIGFQFLNLPERIGFRILRLVVWTVGWFAWLAGGIVSFGHALS